MAGSTRGKHIVNHYNLWVVTFVALGTLATAYGLAIIGSTIGQPNCTPFSKPFLVGYTNKIQSTRTSTSQRQVSLDMHTLRT
jgi:hypothetical protein